MMRKRVVVTGMGVVSAIGNDCGQNLHNLRGGNSGIGRVAFLDTVHTEFPVGEVKLSNEEIAGMLLIRHEKFLSRTQLLAAVAVREALAMSGLAGASRLALVSGTTVGGMDVTEQHYPAALPAGKPPVHDCGSNTNAVADYFGCFDYTSTLSTACSSALNSLIMAKLMIECGERDVVVAGGTEALSRFHLNGFKSLMILDTERCRPFDSLRAGLNLGEGAAYLVLESEEHAVMRGAEILAVLSGAGNACDAYHPTATSETAEGAYLAMSHALEDGCLSPKEISYINAHGTGTPNNDETESTAIKRVFGDNLPPVSSTKSFTGHTTSASGSIEAVFCIMALKNSFIPMNLGFKNADANCLLPYCGSDSSGLQLSHVMCNAFGFGGNDSSIILSRYE